MTVKVEHCWNGKSFYFRLTLPNGAREFVRSAGTDEAWDRKTAIRALDLLATVWRIRRRSVRFVHC